MWPKSEQDCIFMFCKDVYDYLRSHPGEVITIHEYFQPADTLGELVRELKGWGICILSFSSKKLVVCL